MEPIVLSYAAAALECEGSISISRYIDRKNWHHADVHISIANTNYNLMEFMSKHFGGRVNSEEPKKLSKKKIYRWKTYSNKAIVFLKLVRPYMILKAEQADLAIEYQQKRSPNMPHSEKDMYWKRMKALNKGESPAETNREDVGTNLRSDSPTLVETQVS